MPDDVTSTDDESSIEETVEETTEEAPAAIANGDEGADLEPEVEVDPLTAAQQEAADYKDRWIRAAAEFDNYRKRTQREMEALIQRSTEGVVKELLPILDGVDRALVHGGESDSNSEGYRAGVQMLMEQLSRVLAARGLKEVESRGVPFDPNHHEALMQMPSDEFDAGVVSEVVEKGYRMGDRVVRPAKVVVSTGSPPGETEDTAVTAAEDAAVGDRKSAE